MFWTTTTRRPKREVWPAMSTCVHCEWLGKLISVHKSSALISIGVLRQQSQTQKKYYDFKDISNSQKIPSKFTKILTCRVILDSLNGCRAPHLLVAGPPEQDFRIHEVLVCDHNGTFGECGLQFRVKEEHLLGTRDDGYHLLHGPTVVWRQDTKVHIVHGEGMERMTVDIQIVAPHLKLKKIRNMCLLLREVDYSREFGTREWMCLKVQLSGEDPTLNAAAVTQVHNILPSDYGCIAKCISTHKEFHVGSNKGAMLERTVFLVGTEYQQVVLIDGGVLKHIIALQDTPQHVLAVKGCKSDSMDVGVMYASGIVSVHEITEEGPKEKGLWNDVSACLTGDFVGIGCSQILMLANEEDSSSFSLTENNILSPYHPAADDSEGSREEEPQRQDTPKSLLNVLRALHLKKHTAEAQLTHQESSLQHKYALLARSLSFMESLGKDTLALEPKPDPSLVCFFPGNVDVEEELKSGSPSGDFSTEQHVSDLQVLWVWQRVDQGKWIIGVLVKNTSKKLLTGVGMSVMSSGSCDPHLPRESTCKVVWSEASSLKSKIPPSLSNIANSPPEKRRRLELLASAMDSCNDTAESRLCDFEPIEPGLSFCLMMVTDAGIPGSEVAMVGLWRKDGVEGMQTEELSRVKLTSKLICSEELTIDECCLSLWNGSSTLSGESKFHTKETQDLCCLLATHSLTQVEVSARYTELYRLPSMIRARLPLPQHAFQIGSSFSRHSTAPSTGSNTTATAAKKILGGTALHVKLQLESAILSILHKSHCDLHVVLKLLKELLPGDLQFHLLCESDASQHHSLQLALSRIREEASEKAKTLQEALGASRRTREGNTGLDESAREREAEGGDTIVTPTMGDPRLEIATDAALSLLHE